MKYDVMKKHLEEVAKGNSGLSFAQVARLLWFARQVKYFTREQIKMFPTGFPKYRSKDKIDKLVALGLLEENNGIYKTTNEVVELLQTAQLPVEILVSNIEGKGTEENINNTDVFLDCLQREEHNGLFFPDFGYLRPDAVWIVSKIENNLLKYRILFLEVEKKKGNWKEYLQNKRDNYIRLASDYQVYAWWEETVKKIKFPLCKPEEFCFSVIAVGKVDFEYEVWFFSMEKIWIP
jgi:hypothetical protein